MESSGGINAADDTHAASGNTASDAADSLQRDSLPSGARVHAQQQEEARVTLYRSLKTALRLLDARGYVIGSVGSRRVTSLDEARSLLGKYNDPDRVAAAEAAHEIVLVAHTPEPVPRPYTTVAAAGLPAHTIAVIVVDQGKVSTMREVQDAMRLCNFQMAILLSRKALTPFSRRYLLAPVPGILAPIQHFTYADTQAAIVDHELVPLHVPLDAAATARVQERFKAAKLSILRANDPVARFLGLTPGMVVMVRETWGRDQGGITFFQVKDVLT